MRKSKSIVIKLIVEIKVVTNLNKKLIVEVKVVTNLFKLENPFVIKVESMKVKAKLKQIKTGFNTIEVRTS